MIVAVPSKGRAGRTTTNKVLPNLATFFVPQSEVHQYSNINNLVGVPLEIQGITATRNWILQQYPNEWVVFLDDDVKSAGYTKLGERKSEKIEIRSEAFWRDEFVKAFDLAEQLDYKIWGIKTDNSTRATYPYKPVLFKSYVTASCMGIINDGEYMFDEDFKVKEDYEICLRHIVDKGGILAIRYIHWENDHWDQDGGCKDYRTIEVERDAIKRLAAKYPNMIKSAKRKANMFTISLQL